MPTKPRASSLRRVLGEISPRLWVPCLSRSDCIPNRPSTGLGPPGGSPLEPSGALLEQMLEVPVGLGRAFCRCKTGERLVATCRVRAGFHEGLELREGDARDPSSTVSRSGHRVAAMRRRRSSSCSSGTETWKGRIVAPSAPKAMRSGQYVTAMTAVQAARKARRVGDNIGAGMIILRGCRSALGDLDDRIGEGPWGFLRQVVPDPARNGAVRVSAR